MWRIPMYKILLADDEGIAIESLKYVIFRKFGSTCDIRSTQSARHLFDMFQKFQPDIMFLNVQMNGVHGIYTIRKLHAMHKDCIYIVMSHTRKTNYHREGDYMGIAGYLKKPLRKEQALKTLEDTFHRIDQEQELHHRQKSNKEKLQTVIPIIESGFVSELLFRDEAKRNLAPYRELLNIPADYGWIMTLDFCESEENDTQQNPVGAGIQFHQQSALFRTIIKAFFPGSVIGPVLANRVVIFIPCSRPTMSQEEYDFRQDRAEHMMKQLTKKMNLHFRLGIGNVQTVQEIHKTRL